MTDSVRPPSRRDQQWADLATELTPAKSLARIDVVTARAVTTITVVGLLLTGLGALAAGLPTAHNEPAAALAAATVITAALAVASALTAQLLSITRRLNPANLDAVQAWYHRQFDLRAYPTQAATLLLLAAGLLAGATAAAALLDTPTATPSLTVEQTLQPLVPGSTAQPAAVTITATFRGLVPGQIITLSLTSPGVTTPLARAAAVAAPGGTATTTLTARATVAAQPVTVTAVAPRQICRADFTPARTQPALTCYAR